ncbi:MAG: type II secretion system protein GspD [Planctomycetota bacterium]
MSKPSFLTQSLDRKSLSIVVVSILLLITTAFNVAQSQENGATEREKAFRRMVQSYVQAGKEQLNKAYFEQAVKTFQDAQRHQEYLTVAGREELRALLEKAQSAAAKRKLALEKFQAADQLIRQNKLIEAKSSLESLRKNEYLMKDEQVQIAAVLEQIELQAAKDKPSAQMTADKPEKSKEEIAKTDEQQKEKKPKIVDVYYSSMEFYRAGQYEKAREGFVEVAASGLIPPRMKKTIEGYLAEIDKRAPQKTEIETVQEKKTEIVAVIEPKVFNFEASESEINEPDSIDQNGTEPGISDTEELMVSTPGAPSTEKGEGTYIEQITKKRNIIRTYTSTVVNNAATKANSFISQGQFDKAKKEVEAAEFTVNENQIHLGDALFKEYSGKLKELTSEIAEKQNEKALQDEEEKRKAAIEAQNKFREQMETDRQNRISELMKNALAYQEQQKYEAAIGQLKSLLALDPQNNEALILKDTLEEMVFFKKQLQVEKDTQKQRAEILVKTDESQIPYAGELTYPKNWREIVQKPTRQPDKPIGLDPIDAAVYEQLEQIIDLPNLTSTTSFADVIDQLKTVVDPPLKIQPNWKDLLENAEVEQTTPAGMDPLVGVKLRKALELLLAGVSSEFAIIDYVVDEGVIQIATVDTLPQKLVPRVYDVTDLVGDPAQYGGMQGMMMGRMMGMMSGGGGMMGGMGGGMGGMGGMGGGMMGGMGGMGGGMMGGGMMGGQGGIFQAQSLVQLIQESIDPESWFDLSDTGEGTITPYPTQSPKKLAVYNTHEVHREIQGLLTALRKSLGHQVSIEARFLVVTENFLEDIGVDVDFLYDLGGKWGQVSFDQDSAFMTEPTPTQVPLSIGGIGAAAANVVGGYGSILDDLQVSFLIRATQAHREATEMAAPIATVLSGESANFNINRTLILPLPPIQSSGVTQTGVVTGTTQTGGGLQPQYYPIQIGNALSITPIITKDKKNVLLNILTTQNNFLGLQTTEISSPIIGAADGEVQTWEVTTPETEMSSLMTRVSVPDSGTLLMGGQKITAEVEKEAGVPILSKIPIVGRLFSNRSLVRDQKILLILVKPTIMLQEELEAEAIAAMEGEI